MTKTERESSGMRIAIHHHPGSFSDRWVERCETESIPFGIVDCFDSGILNQLEPYDALLWHWNHLDVSGKLFVLPLIKSLEVMGKAVFPNYATCWHYDDKVAQKYLLESIGAPLVPCHVFYDMEKAVEWVREAQFPKVFKLRGGASSSNVRLVRDREEAMRICRQAFGKGFKKYAGYLSDFSTKLGKARKQGGYLARIARIPSTLGTIASRNRMAGLERGYVYFQDFVPGQDHDTRVTVIGDRAFAYRRMVRENDFRASGSGNIDWDPSKVDMECVSIAFETSGKLKSQSMAFDFVKGADSSPQIVEISYCYVAEFVHDCPGHWDRDLKWQEGQMWPQDAILEDLLRGIMNKDGSGFRVESSENRGRILD